MNFLSRLISEYRIKENRTSWFLLFVATLFVILRIPSLVEPHWYGDEGIYQVVGRAIRSGEMLYRDIWDNKPPLLYIIYAIFNGDLFYVKLASLITGLMSLFPFYFLTTYLFKNLRARFASTFIYSLLLALPIIEGNIANAENFMVLPIVVSGLFIFKYLENSEYKYLYIAGFLMSIAFLIKIVAVFDFLAFLIFLIIQKRDFKNPLNINTKKLKPYVFFSLTFSSLMLITIIFFSLSGSFGDFLKGVFSENVNYVNVENDFGFPLGILFIKSLILTIVVFIIYKKAKYISTSEMFIYLWIVFSLYSALFSHRPYTHYLLVVLQPFSLIVGLAIEENKKRILNILLIILLIFIAKYHFSIYKKTLAYYKNYLSFLTSNKSTHEYYSFFDSRTPLDYEIANFINESTTDSEPVFLWSNSAQIYALSNKLPIGKYAVAYHITFYKDGGDETIDAIEKSEPKFIIQTAPERMPKGMLLNYKFRYELDGAKIYEREI